MPLYNPPTGGGGVTNSAGNNVVPKSDGTNLVASSVSDDGTIVELATDVHLHITGEGSFVIEGASSDIELKTMVGEGDGVFLGNTSESFLAIEPATLNQWHAHPNNLQLDSTGLVLLGDYGANNGNQSGIRISDAADLSVRINALGSVIAGDVLDAGNSTLLTVDDIAETITLKADDGVVQSTPASSTAAILANGQISFYLDEATHKLKVAVKYSDGTTKTGELALT
jgi:hypothetical protein